ncbi:hypothetical protein TrVE_jg6813 [Triparma verrucosa]|uniref:Uncharacterized protein n=1 Tax=Triparma verrucosa TaxID=1606542 RepID=A0A9W7BJI9_9STRA|nr:hypothetical protein TrVE_jg6813 [Triparma verrucosa]
MLQQQHDDQYDRHSHDIRSATHSSSAVLFDTDDVARSNSHLFQNSVVIVLSSLPPPPPPAKFTPLSPPPSLLPHHLISTSGSAGTPLLTRFSTSSIHAYCMSRIEYENITSSSTLLQLSQSTFDPSISDVVIFHLLSSNLVLYDNSPINDLIECNNITHIITTKGIVTTLGINPNVNVNDNDNDNIDVEPTTSKYHLKVLSVGGEHVTQDFIDAYARAADSPADQTRLVLNYGLTELGVYQSSGEVFKHQSEHVGRLFSDFEVDFIDVDDGGFGEIVIRGGWIDETTGYVLDDDEANGFIKNSNANNVDSSWKVKGYRTGDTGRIDPDSNLVIGGRIGEGMFKVNGVLINELEVVEAIEKSIENCAVYVSNSSNMFTVWVALFDDINPPANKWYARNSVFNKVLEGVWSKFNRSSVRVNRWIVFHGDEEYFRESYVPKETVSALGRTGKTQSVKQCTLPKLPVYENVSAFSDSSETTRTTLSSPLGIFVSEQVKAVLNLTSPPTSDQTFTELGGDSLGASRVVRACYAEYNGLKDGRLVGGEFGRYGAEWDLGGFISKPLGDWVDGVERSGITLSSSSSLDLCVDSASLPSAASDLKMSMYDCLIKCVTLGYLNLVKALIEVIGVNPNLNAHDGRIGKEGSRNVRKASWKSTPLHIACSNGRPEVLKYLLSLGTIKVLTPDATGTFPIHLAAGKCLACVKTMLSHNIPLTVRDANKHTLLHSAARAGKSDVLTYVMDLWLKDESIKVPKKDGKLDQTDRWQRTPVHWAVLNKQERCLVQLLESGASVGEERSDMGLKGTSLKKETPREIAKRIGWGKEILERYAQIRN